MKFTTQEEYGLRCLVRLGNSYTKGVGLTIPDISNNEGISEDNVAKTLRLLRLNGYLESERGRIGGYSLTKHPKDILIGDVMGILGGKFFESSYCQLHNSESITCTHSTDCSIRSFWQLIQKSIDQIMNNLTLQDLLNSEKTVYDETSKKIDLLETN